MLTTVIKMLTTVIGFCELVYSTTGTKLINSGIFTNCQTSTCGAQYRASILPWLLGISFCSAVQGTMANQSYTVKKDREIWRLSGKSHKWALQRKSYLCIPFLGIELPQSQFPHSCVSERFIYSQDRSTYFPRKIGRTILGTYNSLTDRWVVEIGTMAAQFHFWE